MSDEWESFLSGKPSSYKQPPKTPYQHQELRKGASTQEILDSLAMGSSVIPVIGDAMGIAADANMYKNDPESRTAGNFALSALGLLPFVPPVSGVIKQIKGITRTAKDSSDIFGPGTNIVRLTDDASGGTIEIVQRPNGEPASIIELVVPESSRKKGIAKKLQELAQKENPYIMGQVSSKYAAKNAYDLGRRPFGKPNATLKEVYQMIDENSSVNLISGGFND